MVVRAITSLMEQQLLIIRLHKPIVVVGTSLIFNNTIVPAGATNLNTTYEANNGGYDAYIRIVNAVSALTTQPTYQIELKYSIPLTQILRDSDCHLIQRQSIR